MADTAPPFCLLSPADALRFWYERTNFEMRQAAPSELKLDRMRLLLAQLGDPHHRLRIVHVAGTKGKGSTCAMLAAILGQAGYRTGLFTSPHLHTVEERFQVAGKPITSPELTALLSEIQQACRVVPDATFFEIATALGLLFFVRRRVEVAILEVGLGGRFDSTNVCTPAVAVITSISFDHMKQLGNTLAAIAFEKAGIIKPNRPTVSGVTATEARDVVERISRERRSHLWQMNRDFFVTSRPGRVTADETQLPRVTIRTPGRTWADLTLNLLGEHQAANAALAVMTVEELQRQGWPLHERAVRAGLANVDWPGRMEVVRRRPLILLDCAHNVASAEVVVHTLNESFPVGSSVRRWLLLGVSNDKDVAGIVRVLAPHFHPVVVTRFTSSQRAVSPEELVAAFAQVGTAAQACEHPRAALDWIADRAAPEDIVCATGSVFLVGEVRAALRENRSA